MPYTYLMASRSRVLYVGVCRDLRERIWHHKRGTISGFTRQYRVTRLVWYEQSEAMASAIAREKQIKSWRREKKMALIEAQNAGWLDLAVDWFPADAAQVPRAR